MIMDFKMEMLKSLRYCQKSAIRLLKHPESAICFFDGTVYIGIEKKSRRYYVVVSKEFQLSTLPVFKDSDGYQYFGGYDELETAVMLFRAYVQLYINKDSTYGV